MKSNMGLIDKIIRVIIAAVVAILYFTHVITGVIGIILLIVGAVFLLTVIINFCPIYYPFGLSTKGKGTEKK